MAEHIVCGNSQSHDQFRGRIGPVELVITMTILEVIEIHLFKEINGANF